MNENQTSENKNENEKRLKKNFAKLCPHCGKKTKVKVIKYSKNINSVKQFLIKLFSPGGVQINQRYKCPRCSHEFDDMSFSEAVIAPMILITIVILSVVLFLIFVFYAVAKETG